jgi:hypothetical protein
VASHLTSGWSRHIRVRNRQRPLTQQGQRPATGAHSGGQAGQRDARSAWTYTAAARQSTRPPAHLYQPADRSRCATPLRHAPGRPLGFTDDARGVRAGTATNESREVHRAFDDLLASAGQEVKVPTGRGDKMPHSIVTSSFSERDRGDAEVTEVPGGPLRRSTNND